MPQSFPDLGNGAEVRGAGNPVRSRLSSRLDPLESGSAAKIGRTTKAAGMVPWKNFVALGGSACPII
jgi:hypothetical protein